MTATVDSVGSPPQSLLPFLDRAHRIAGPGYSCWMVAPAALCVCPTQYLAEHGAIVQ